MTDNKEFTGRTLIYSNRPPTAGSSGGAQQVIEATNPTWWIGPESTDNRMWNMMDHREREEITKAQSPNREEAPDYDVLTFPAPKSLEEAQYKTISNEILWPVAHSMKPTTSASVEKIEEAYFAGYLPHNDLANHAVRQLSEKNNITADDRIWVHDYQCDNVPGMIYSRHIPWPSLEFLESVSFKSEKGQDVPLLETNFYRDLIELGSARALSTFQRPVDQVNYIMTAAYVAGEGETKDGKPRFAIESDNPALANVAADIRDPSKREAIREALTEEIAIGSSTHLTLFGANTTLLNVPVGQVTELTYQKAKNNETSLDKTKFQTSGDDWKIFHAGVGEGQTVNLTASQPEEFDKQNPPTVAGLVEPIRGRNWVLSVHRNDYTKGTLTKLEAAEQLFEKEPQRAKDSTFLFVLQPTREDVAGYKEYAEEVFRKAAAMKEKFGEKSVVIIPEAVKHDDIVGLMRQPEMKGFMGLGLKDGHDLTLREVVDSNERDRAIGVIASSGVGAADVLSNGKQGAFVIKNPADAQEVAAALSKALDPANEEKLRADFSFMKDRSTQFSALNFSDTVTAAYPAAMAHKFGAEWKKEFQQPAGIPIEKPFARRGLKELKGFGALADAERSGTPAHVEKLLNERIAPPSTTQRAR